MREIAMKPALAVAAALVLGAGLTAAAPAPRAMVTFSEMKTWPRPKPSASIVYGGEPAQFVDLWLPAGPGPHPVVVMIHGGCWTKAVAGADLMNFAAQDLARRGYAVWNIEYRGVDEPGGGYPGTFEDVGRAIDLLRTEAPKHGLKLDRVIATGHSAGGHLALWAAARGRIPASSALYVANPLRLDAVLATGELGDLEELPRHSNGCGGADLVQRLVGPATATHPDPFTDTSPVRLEPFSARQILLHGGADAIAPAHFGETYRDGARKRGGEAELTVVPDQGHFDLIAPGTVAFEREVTLISGLFRLGRFGSESSAAKPAAAKPW